MGAMRSSLECIGLNWGVAGSSPEVTAQRLGVNEGLHEDAG